MTALTFTFDICCGIVTEARVGGSSHINQYLDVSLNCVVQGPLLANLGNIIIHLFHYIKYPMPNSRSVNM